MSNKPEIVTIETHRGIPIVKVQYPEPVLLTRDAHATQLRELLAFEADHLAVVVSFDNVSCSNQYGPDEQAKLYQDPEFADLQEKILCLFRFHAQSLTALVSTMSAHAMIQQGASNFAPDEETAVRAARRAIDQFEIELA